MLDCMARPQLITRLENGMNILSGILKVDVFSHCELELQSLSLLTSTPIKRLCCLDLTGFSEEVDTTNIQSLRRKLEDFVAKLKNVTEEERKMKEGQKVGHATTKKMKFKSQVEFLQVRENELFFRSLFVRLYWRSSGLLNVVKLY